MSVGSAHLALAAGVAAFALLVLAPRTSGAGPEMDEGAVVAYADRVLDGAFPQRDYLSFYGPANPVIVAGAFEVAGRSVLTERVVGLVYRVTIVLALFFIGLRLGGLLGGALAGVLSACALANELVWASPTYGSIAGALLSIALLAHVASAPPGRLRTFAACGAGIAGGIALLMRFDFALAVVAAAVPFVPVIPRRERLWFGGSFLLTAGLYLPHLAFVGPRRTERLLDDLEATRAGRLLPLPAPFSNTGLLLVAAGFATAVLLALGFYLLWRENSIESRLLLAVGFLGVTLVPWVVFRADIFHIRPFAVIPLSLVPAVALLLVGRAGRLSLTGRTVVRVLIAACSLSFVVGSDLNVIDDALAFRGVRNGYHGFYRTEGGGAVAAVVAEAKTRIRPGDSLFVGPRDLRRTNYGPTYIYFLLPQARPASYFMEMNPKTANREGSGLADELRSADWLILTSEWDGFREPNASSDFGPVEPNRVVATEFCLRYERGTYGLYQRCERGGHSGG